MGYASPGLWCGGGAASGSTAPPPSPASHGAEWAPGRKDWEGRPVPSGRGRHRDAVPDPATARPDRTGLRGWCVHRGVSRQPRHAGDRIGEKPSTGEGDRSRQISPTCEERSCCRGGVARRWYGSHPTSDDRHGTGTGAALHHGGPRHGARRGDDRSGMASERPVRPSRSKRPTVGRAIHPKCTGYGKPRRAIGNAVGRARGRVTVSRNRQIWLFPFADERMRRILVYERSRPSVLRSRLAYGSGRTSWVQTRHAASHASAAPPSVARRFTMSLVTAGMPRTKIASSPQRWTGDSVSS